MLLRRRPIAVPRSLLPQLTDHIEGEVTRRGPRWSRATVTGIGSVPGTVLVRRTGETVSDGGDVPVYRAYGSATYGQPNGPQAGDDALLLETSPGNPAVLAQTAFGAPPSAAGLGVLVTHVASQRISGTSTRGIVRITAAATPPSAGVVAHVLFAAVLPSVPFITLSAITGSLAAYGDATTATAADLSPACTNVSGSGFDLAISSTPGASLSYAWIYSVIL